MNPALWLAKLVAECDVMLARYPALNRSSFRKAIRRYKARLQEPCTAADSDELYDYINELYWQISTSILHTPGFGAQHDQIQALLSQTKDYLIGERGKFWHRDGAVEENAGL